MREVLKEIKFNVPGTFESYYAACHWLNENGYSYGDTACGRSPHCGIVKGEVYIPKWYHLKKKEVQLLDGVMTSFDYREGEVVIRIFK